VLSTNNKYFEEDNPISSYQLTPEQLTEIHIKYGLPGELSPGHKAKKSRRHMNIMSRWGNQKNKTTIE